LVTIGIAVMAKAPRAGYCKTRLMPHLSAEQAAMMSAAFLADVTTNLALAASSGSIVPYLAFAPAGTAALFDGMLAPGTRMLVADGLAAVPDGVSGFGRCLLQAVEAMLAQGHDAACVLNADSPTLPTRLLLETEAALTAEGDRIVLGPCEDGGYYLLGMKQAHAALFSGIDWSTGRVAAQTRQRAADAGLAVVELDSWYDVDEPAELARLLAELGGVGPADAFPAPHTTACVAQLKLAGAPKCP